MGILLVILGIIVVISVIIFAYMCSAYSHKSLRGRLRMTASGTFVWASAIGLIYGIFTVVCIMGSYDTYLDARAYYDNIIAQYRGAITLYEDKAVALDMEKAVKQAITDLRFQGYQDKMGDFVMDLRESVTTYNKCIIKKRIMDKNFFYSWYVIPPDTDMQLIDIISKN